MDKESCKKMAGRVLLLLLCVGAQGCASRYRLTMPIGTGMQGYAEERYALALQYMGESRYELAQQQFAIAERTAVSGDLRQLAHEGYTKAAGVIEAKR